MNPPYPECKLIMGAEVYNNIITEICINSYQQMYHRHLRLHLSPCAFQWDQPQNYEHLIVATTL